MKAWETAEGTFAMEVGVGMNAYIANLDTNEAFQLYEKLTTYIDRHHSTRASELDALISVAESSYEELTSTAADFYGAHLRPLEEERDRLTERYGV